MSKYRRSYAEAIEGKWTPMNFTGQVDQCCDCSLIHRTDYRVIQRGKKRELQFRCWRDDRATEGIRRRAGITVSRAKE